MEPINPYGKVIPGLVYILAWAYIYFKLFHVILFT